MRCTSELPTAPWFSRRLARRYGRLWQQGYHDYLLVSRQMIESTERYIAYNPLKWELMYGVADALRIHEPIHSSRLDVGDYWKSDGNVANARFKPERVYVGAFAERRCLEIGKGNDEVEFGRSLCLDLNAEAVEIATACSGIALYWNSNGPHVTAKEWLRVLCIF